MYWGGTRRIIKRPFRIYRKREYIVCVCALWKRSPEKWKINKTTLPKRKCYFTQTLTQKKFDICAKHVRTFFDWKQISIAHLICGKSQTFCRMECNRIECYLCSVETENFTSYTGYMAYAFAIRLLVLCASKILFFCLLHSVWSERHKLHIEHIEWCSIWPGF